MSLVLPRPGSLAARFSLLLAVLLSIQAVVAGLAVSSWLRSRDLRLHALELREQAALLLPAVEDSLAQWAGMGPVITRQAELRHRMQLSLGRPQAMSLVWIDHAGNMASAGFLNEDPRLARLKELAAWGASATSIEQWAAEEKLPLVARPVEQGWLILAGAPGMGLWNSSSRGLLAIILAGSAAAAGLVAWLLARPVLRRFRRIHGALQRLGDGAMSHRLEDLHSDELGELALEFNRMAARLEQLTSALEQSDRRRRQLLSEVSHELGAPLTNIIGYLEVLNRGEGLDEQSRPMARLCLEQSRRLDGLVQDLLDLARLDEAGLRLQCRRLDLRDMVDQEIAAVELACLDRDITLSWQRPLVELSVQGDEARLAQVLRNLLRNAVQHLSRDDVDNPVALEDSRRELQVELRQLEGAALLQVRDNGRGIRPEDLAHLFDRYHRPQPQHGMGSGLGLCISRRLAELHGGTLVAHSPGLGRGALFELRLPLSDSE